MRSSTETLIKAMHILSQDIQSDDGVANAAIAEAAQRLEEQQDRIKQLGEELNDNGLVLQKIQHERDLSNDRIKRLEEAGNNLLWNFCPEYTSDFTESQSDALKQWNKAKEAKP